MILHYIEDFFFLKIFIRMYTIDQFSSGISKSITTPYFATRRRNLETIFSLTVATLNLPGGPYFRVMSISVLDFLLWFMVIVDVSLNPSFSFIKCRFRLRAKQVKTLLERE